MRKIYNPDLSFTFVSLQKTKPTFKKMTINEFRTLTPTDRNLDREDRINNGPIAPPEDRIPAEMKEVLDKHKVFDSNAVPPAFNQLFFDVHAHCFTMEHLPDDGTIKAIADFFAETQSAFLKLKGATRVANFLRRELISSKGGVDAMIFEYFEMFRKTGMNVMPDMVVVELMMDFRGKYAPEKYAETNLFYNQFRDIHELRTKRSDNGPHPFNKVILPFFAADPNNPRLFEDFLAAFCVDIPVEAKTDQNEFLDGQPPFFGVKLYPPLGYLPTHPKLMEIFRVCEHFEIPVLTHCGGGRTRHREDEFTIEVLDDNNPSRTLAPAQKRVAFNETGRKKRGEAVAKFFSAPENWVKVIRNFPKLKINLAHWGSNAQWRAYRKGPTAENHVHQSIHMILGGKNVYGDISYTYSINRNRDAIKVLFEDNVKGKVLQDKILFGSDFCLTLQEKKSPIEMVADLIDEREGFGVHLMNRFATLNPIKYLFMPPLE